MTQSIDHIIGAEQLVAVFGDWPSFHDAEVLGIRLARGAPGEGNCCPTLEAMIHVFEMTGEVDDCGFYVLRHHVLVHFRFTEVVELVLEGFNEQNALEDLSLTDLRDRQMERVKWQVCFDSSYGVSASFQCFAVEVVSVAPFDAPDDDRRPRRV